MMAWPIPGLRAQQLGDDPSKWPDVAVPSRFGPDDMSFTSMFSNEGEVTGRVLLSPADEAQGGALFVQLYGQGQVAGNYGEPFLKAWRIASLA